jgi:hypothetical protein
MLLAGTSDARGFGQWDEAGRWVVKGTKAFHILGPIVKDVRVLKCSVCGKVVPYRDQHKEHQSSLYEAKDVRTGILVGYLGWAV